MIPCRRVLTCLLVLVVSNFVVENNGGQYKFSEKTVKSVSLKRTRKYKYPRLKKPERCFLDVNLEDRKKMCLEARDYARIPKENSQGDDFYVAEAHLYKMDGHKVVAIRCPTIPSIYVAPRSICLDFLLLIKVQSPYFCDNCKFDLESVKSVSEIPYENDMIEKLYIHHLATVDAEDRWHLCVLAQKYVRRLLTLGSHDVQKPKLYEFDYSSWKERHLAIKCPSTPVIYLRFRNSGNENVMRIILIDIQHRLDG